jgi:alpha-L-rhamnosidase
LTSAQASVESPYGLISSAWQIEKDAFTLQVQVPCNTECLVELPNGEKKEIHSGKHVFQCKIEADSL